MQKIRRNSICPCGCGKKFKVCLADRREQQRVDEQNYWRAYVDKIMERSGRGPTPLRVLVMLAGDPDKDPSLNPYSDLPYMYWKVVHDHNATDLNSEWFRVWSRVVLAIGAPGRWDQ